MSVRRKRRLPAVALTTSMGDIAFLLIIFFILAGITKKEKKFTPPEAPRLDELKGAVTITLDANGMCSVNDEDNVPLDGLAEKIRLLLAKNKDNKLVIVEIDKNQKRDAFTKVMLAVGEAGGKVGAAGIEPVR